ncbi:uncharacterized protein LOC122061688 [Macadamia integrifolia]|uniref:uncharacterized protein LOC122061688 n=1 Tax=Macadamia integrifolia TaxID=60698 RepID=UPI001C5316E2|nr:uncharacterized protein LOC122061688 [Macadamia integrifolia]
MDHPEFLDLINVTWSINVSGSPTYILAQKLKALKHAIRSWLLEAFSNLNHEVAIAKSGLDDIQRCLEEEAHSEQLVNLEADAKTKYWNAIDNHEKLWVQKSRIRWLKDGDRCSRFFHVMAKVKRARNSIRSIITENGSEVSDLDQLGSYLSDFYENFHKKVDLEYHPHIFNCIPNILQDHDWLMLDAIPSDDEIKKAVWDLDPDSSPGLDGFSGSFFRRCWMIINLDVCRVVKGFFSSGILPYGIYANFLLLIPKVLGSFKKFMAITGVFEAEVEGLMEGLMCAKDMNVIQLRVESDSSAVVTMVHQRKIPWYALQQWMHL